jgi:hypothetical protein
MSGTWPFVSLAVKPVTLARGSLSAPLFLSAVTKIGFLHEPSDINQKCAVAHPRRGLE